MFVILAHQRSGTHLLASLLDSHPELRSYDEIFISPKSRLRFSRKELKELDQKEGCIVMYSHFLRLTGDLRGLIARSHVIHLMRRNLYNQAKSITRMNPSRQEGLDYEKRQIIKYREKVFNGKRKFPNLFEIYYEDICDDKNIKEYENRQLLEFLGVKPMKLTTNLKKGVDP